MYNDAKYQYTAGVLKAMAHPGRLYILDLLNEKECSVGELQQLLELDMSTVSRHLAILRTAGIINSRKLNNQVLYKMLCPCVLDMYKCVNKMADQGGN